MKKFLEEFKAFALKGNVMDMAVGVIVGGAFTGIVTALTDDFINPILSLIMGGAAYTGADWIGFGADFLSTIINFLITALVLFVLLKSINKMLTIGKKPEVPAAPTTKTCPFCKTDIHIEATKCPNCTSDQPKAA